MVPATLTWTASHTPRRHHQKPHVQTGHTHTTPGERGPHPHTHSHTQDRSAGSQRCQGVLRGLPPAAPDDGQMVIRPLCLIRARDIDAWARANGVAMPERRSFPARDRLFDALGREDANVEMNIFNCIFAVRPETLPTMFNGEGS